LVSAFLGLSSGKFGVPTPKVWQDVVAARELSAVEREIHRIPGRSSGLSRRYFLPLAGREDLVKQDRMIHRILERAIGPPVGPNEAHAMLTTAELDHDFPAIKLRRLDTTIWKSERSR
jgi:hypothetical protein